MRTTFVICEGVHDIALLMPMLKKSDFKDYKVPLKNYPPPIANILIQRYRNRPVEEARSRSEDFPIMDSAPVFARACYLDEQLVLFFVAHGDAQNEAIRTFLRLLVEQASNETPRDQRLPPFGICLVRDADENGVVSRVEEIRNEFRELLLPVLPRFDEIENGKMIRDGEWSAGCCIFTNEGTEYGNLEDALSPDLESTLGRKWADADAFIEEHQGKAASSLSKRLKATITICGQIEYPGFSQAVVLRETLKNEDLLVKVATREWYKLIEQCLLDVITPPPPAPQAWPRP